MNRKMFIIYIDQLFHNLIYLRSVVPTKSIRFPKKKFGLGPGNLFKLGYFLLLNVRNAKKIMRKTKTMFKMNSMLQSRLPE